MGDVRKHVILLILARSGSSMVTAIFGAHGFSLGKSGFVNPAGYRAYENIQIRAAVNAICHVDMVDPSCTKHFKRGYGPSHIRHIFERLLPGVGPWCYKAGIHDWEIMQASFPDGIFVGVRRKTDSVIKSTFEKQNLSMDEVERRVRAQQRKLDTVTSENGFPVVNSDEVVSGDFTSLEVAFKYCNTAFNESLAKKCIDPKKWKHA